MKLSSKAESIHARINSKTTKLGDLRNIAKDIKKDHQLAMELWSISEYLPRQLAILIMDPKLLSQELIDNLDQDIQHHMQEERLQLIDWLMANQLSKVHSPLNFWFFTFYSLFNGRKQGFGIGRRCLPHPPQTTLVIPKNSSLKYRRAIFPRLHEGNSFFVFRKLVGHQPIY